ncbi:MAG: cupin domain-containing protein [Pseudolabrys sp.]
MRAAPALTIFAALAAVALLAPPATSKEPAKPGYPLVPLLSTAKTITGETIRYPQGAAHVTAAIVTLAPGGRTIEHRHGVPLFAYILSGTLVVDYGAQGQRTYRPGDAFMEAMDVAHHGLNTGTEPVRILAVYMGAAGAKDVIPVQ